MIHHKNSGDDCTFSTHDNDADLYNNSNNNNRTERSTATTENHNNADATSHGNVETVTPSTVGDSEQTADCGPQVASSLPPIQSSNAEEGAGTDVSTSNPEAMVTVHLGDLTAQQGDLPTQLDDNVSQS